MNRVIAYIVGYTFLSGCAPVSEVTPTDQVASQNAMALCDSIISQTGNNLDDAISNFGRPDGIEQKEVTSPHDETLKNIRIKLIYQGGHVAFYELPKYEKSHLEAAEYTIEFTPGALSEMYGRSIDDVQVLLGVPNMKTENELRYSCSVESSEQLNLVFKEGQLYKVVLSIWVD